VAISVGYLAEDSVQQSVFAQEAEVELDVRRWLGRGESVLRRVVGSVRAGSVVVRHSQRADHADQVFTIRCHVRSVTNCSFLPRDDMRKCVVLSRKSLYLHPSCILSKR